MKIQHCKSERERGGGGGGGACSNSSNFLIRIFDGIFEN